MASYHPIKPACADLIDFVIHAVPMVGPEEMDEADLDDAGQCRTAGAYRIRLLPGRRGPLFARNQALEIFHALGVISDAEDYRLVVSTYAPTIDTALRQDLGAWAEAGQRRHRPISLRRPAPSPEDHALRREA